MDSIVGPDLAEHLLAALRELLSNVIRHARATAVEVRVRAGVEVILTVEDDGVGLGAERGPASASPTSPSGLAPSAAPSRSKRAATHGVRAVWSVPRETAAEALTSRQLATSGDASGPLEIARHADEERADARLGDAMQQEDVGMPPTNPSGGS